MNHLRLQDDVRAVAGALGSIPFDWDGRDSITQMKEGGSSQWRQMEWIGFYFEFLCQRHLSSILNMPGPSFGRVGFDAQRQVPWDLKSHVTGPRKDTLIVNDTEAIHDAIQKFGAVGLLVASGIAIYDDERGSFRDWHDKLKGAESEYVKQRKARGAKSRRRKVRFTIKEFLICGLDEDSLKTVGSFQRGMRNADGSPRREKVSLNLRNLSREVLQTVRPGTTR